MFEARKQPRTSERLLVQISSLAEPWVTQSASTENVSPHGARVVMKRSWTRGSRVLVKSPDGDLLARGRVVYCEALSREAFAVGIEFLARTGEWIMRRSSWQLWDKKK